MTGERVTREQGSQAVHDARALRARLDTVAAELEQLAEQVRIRAAELDTDAEREDPP